MPRVGKRRGEAPTGGRRPARRPPPRGRRRARAVGPAVAEHSTGCSRPVRAGAVRTSGRGDAVRRAGADDCSAEASIAASEPTQRQASSAARGRSSTSRCGGSGVAVNGGVRQPGPEIAQVRLAEHAVAAGPTTAASELRAAGQGPVDDVVQGGPARMVRLERDVGDEVADRPPASGRLVRGSQRGADLRRQGRPGQRCRAADEGVRTNAGEFAQGRDSGPAGSGPAPA